MMASQNELDVIAELRRAGLQVVEDIESRRMPVRKWPWMTTRSRVSPTCDLYLPDAKLYVEIKGFMTIYAMAKMAWLSQAGFGYYVFQATEEDWDPFTDALDAARKPPEEGGTRRIRSNVARQVEELRFVCSEPARASQCGHVSRARIRRYIEIRATEFKEWAGEWP